ncbi:MAG TPA: Asp-tRNA(Asn)/Glu-tRNA(Gln) amidotransferase subunit GatC [Acidimicrobiales bacterium]|nr:Asp-tRNA(Asn)/Glu-tRNA(Gln) amidotransferase subunit GatC [Acidimicrobiales bacterium]
MTAKLSREDVVHVARLARIALSDDELDRYAEQLANVLEHAAAISALDTAGVAPTAHPLPLRNVMRPDEVVACLDRETVLSEAPEAEEGRFRVPPILGESP